MSTGLELLPLALAASTAIALLSRRAGAGRLPLTAVATRLREEEPAIAALARCGTHRGAIHGLPHGDVDGTEVALTREADGTLSLLFDETVDETVARAVTLRLDQAYCAVLQERLVAELRARAGSLGYSVGDPTPGPGGGRMVSIVADDGAGATIGFRSDGSVSATTFGTVGTDCLPWIPVVEELTDSATSASSYTDDFFASTPRARSESAQAIEQALWARS